MGALYEDVYIVYAYGTLQYPITAFYFAKPFVLRIISNKIECFWHAIGEYKNLLYFHGPICACPYIILS